ncbi:MAG: hypothetical protein HYR51_03695 [Candidatus Rokubacteria bacterium]|nr:hypothetical protein [Candidatus Rokubacteria bacterium]
MSQARRHHVLAVVGLAFLVIAAERLVNMLIIGRPFADLTVRASVFQWSLAAGVVLLVVSVLIHRDH